MGRKDCVYHCVRKRKRDNSAALKKATEARMKNRLKRVEEDSTFRSDAVPGTSRTSDNSDSVTEVVLKEHVAVDPGDLDESMKLSDSIVQRSSLATLDKARKQREKIKMPYCSVLQCKNDSRLGGISYHRFPQDPLQKAKWIEATGRLNWIPPKTNTICSVHFKEQDFVKSAKGSKYLSRKAIPTQRIYPFSANPRASSILHDSVSIFLDLFLSNSKDQYCYIFGPSSRMEKLLMSVILKV